MAFENVILKEFSLHRSCEIYILEIRSSLKKCHSLYSEIQLCAGRCGGESRVVNDTRLMSRFCVKSLVKSMDFSINIQLYAAPVSVPVAHYQNETSTSECRQDWLAAAEVCRPAAIHTGTGMNDLQRGPWVGQVNLRWAVHVHGLTVTFANRPCPATVPTLIRRFTRHQFKRTF